MEIPLAASRTPELIGQPTALWRRSVEATHGFLAPADVDRIAERVPAALEGIEALAVAQGQDGRPLGFAGIQDGSLEMLFVDPAQRSQGIGRALLRFATEEAGARRLEVNEQNPQARRFYEHCGWRVVGYRETDDDGEPFPLLEMERAAFGVEELSEAKRQIDSTLHKLRQTVEALSAKERPERLKSQMTLAKRRIDAFEVASALIERELDRTDGAL